MNDEMKRTYLGDSVYAYFDGYTICLTTENNMPCDPSNKIFLEPEVMENLAKYAQSVYKISKR